MDLSTQAQSTDPGAAVAHRMIIGGIVAWILGALIFWGLWGSNSAVGPGTVFFGSISTLGMLLAVPGLHALAIRAK